MLGNAGLGGVFALGRAGEGAFLADGDDGADLPQGDIAHGRPGIRKLNAEAQNILFLSGAAIRHSISRQSSNNRRVIAPIGRTPWDCEFRHRRPGLAAAGQLGPAARIPHRARAHDDEEARARRHALHVRRERALHHRHADAGLEPAQARPALRHAVRRRRGRSCSSRATSASRSSGTRRGSRRRTCVTPSPGSKARPVRPRSSR